MEYEIIAPDHDGVCLLEARLWVKNKSRWKTKWRAEKHAREYNEQFNLTDPEAKRGPGVSGRRPAYVQEF